MKKITAPFMVGLVFIGGLLLLFYMFGTVDSDQSSARDTYKVLARFDDASGLVRLSRVMISGIPVGNIEAVDLDPGDISKALVTIRVNSRIALLEGIQDEAGVYRGGTQVRRSQASLLGDYFIEIVPGIRGEIIPDGGFVRDVVSTSGMGAMMDKLNESASLLPAIEKLVVDLGAVTENLKHTLGGDQGAERMSLIAEDIRKATENISAITGEIRGFVEGEGSERTDSVIRIIENIEQFSSNAAELSASSGVLLHDSLMNLRDVTGQVRNLVGKSGPEVEESIGTIKGTLEKVEESLDILQETLDTMHHVARKVDSGQGTVGRLVNDDRLIDDLENTVAGASDFVTGIQRLQTHVDLRSDYLMRSGSFRTAFGLRLQPRPDKYYLFEIIDSPRGLRSVSQRSTVTTDASGTSNVDETTTSVEDRLRFSVQYAKRLSFSTWRLGIIENSGGLGLDLELWRRHLSLTAEAFEMDLYDYPRLRSYLQFHFLKVFFVSAGIDDPLNENRRDGFVGLGLRFEDKDLKTLFTATPSVSF